MRRWLLVWLLAGGVMVSPCHAGSPNVIVGSIDGASGGVAAVPLSLHGAEGWGRFELRLAFDPQSLAFEGLTVGPPLDAALARGTLVESGQVWIGAVLPPAVPSGKPVVWLRFRVTGATGTTTPLRVLQVRGWAPGGGAELPADAREAGVRIVPAPPPGQSLSAEVLGAGVLVLFCTFLLLLRRRKAKQRAPAQATAPPPVQAPPRVILLPHRGPPVVDQPFGLRETGHTSAPAPLAPPVQLPPVVLPGRTADARDASDA